MNHPIKRQWTNFTGMQHIVCIHSALHSRDAATQRSTFVEQPPLAAQHWY
jgi:hypothetical protein